VRQWIRRQQVDTAARPGVTSEAQEEIKGLKREVSELRRASKLMQRLALMAYQKPI